MALWLRGNQYSQGKSDALRCFSGFHVGPVSAVGPAGVQLADEEETIGYELKAVLFTDGTFIGPDPSSETSPSESIQARSLPRDTQYLRQDKYIALEQDEFLKAMRRVNASIGYPSISASR